MPALAADQIPLIEAYGETVVAATEATGTTGYRIGAAGGFWYRRRTSH